MKTEKSSEKPLMNIRSILSAATLCAVVSCSGTPLVTDVCGTASWGDQGNGTYINPILAADFSDPDVIRVDDTYYMVASDFHFMGMQVLKSRDMVNWEYVTRIYERLDAARYDEFEGYGNGSWAPTIRYHGGKFFMFVCSPTEGLWMSCTGRVEGPWSKPVLVHEGTGPGWEDPCPFWDEDGQAYLGHSLVGAGPIILHKMSADGTRLLDEGVEIYRGPVAEGTKIHKIDGTYYFSIPEGGVTEGNQVVLRSKSLYGPFEKKIVQEKGSTDINGPHQGALVDTPEGEWWFYHFQDTGALGRVVHLQPVHWADGWPVVGVDIDRNGIGEPVYCWKMPVSGSTPSKPATSDSFDSSELSLQWQFNHNPVDGGWSLDEKPGTLTIHALKADNFRSARNSIGQKLMGYTGNATVRMDVQDIADGQYCGLAVMGNVDQLIGIRRTGNTMELFRTSCGTDSPADISEPFKGKSVWLRFSFDTHKEQFSLHYSLDGKEFNAMGGQFSISNGYWKGIRPTLFCYNVLKDEGSAGFDDFMMKFN